MKSVMTSYYEEIALLTLRVRELLKYAFDFEVPSCEYATSLMRMNYYPRIIEEVPANQWRISEHADFCMFTILLTEAPNPEIAKINKDMSGGLELFTKEKGWYKTSYDHSSFVVNCGDTLEMLSNVKCKSSFHRVGIPPISKRHDNSRASIAYFCAADYLVDKKTVESYQNLIDIGNASAR
jgi:isopenicillin N synthase-like dioxygenase